MGLHPGGGTKHFEGAHLFIIILFLIIYRNRNGVVNGPRGGQAIILGDHVHPMPPPGSIPNYTLTRKYVSVVVQIWNKSIMCICNRARLLITPASGKKCI